MADVVTGPAGFRHGGADLPVFLVKRPKLILKLPVFGFEMYLGEKHVIDDHVGQDKSKQEKENRISTHAVIKMIIGQRENTETVQQKGGDHVKASPAQHRAGHIGETDFDHAF